MSFWRQMLEDDNGNPSSTRVLVACIVVYCVLASTLILSVWAYLSLTSGIFLPLGVGELSTLATSVLAILFKVINKKFEEKSSSEE